MQQYTAKVITIDFAPKRLGTNGKNNIKKTILRVMETIFI